MTIDGKPRHFLSDVRKFIFIGQCAEFPQMRVAVGNGAAGWSIDKWKFLNGAYAEKRHAQNNVRQIASHDFRHGKRFAALIILFGIESHAHAFPHAAASAFPLVGARARYVFNGKAGHARMRRKPLDARKPGVDNVTDVGNGYGGFGNG